MVNLLSFYFNQTRHGLKQSYLVILSIGLALSMVWAVNFTIEGGLSARFHTGFTNTEDFVVQIRQDGNVSGTEIAHELLKLNTSLKEISEVENDIKNLKYNRYSFLDLEIDGGSFGGRPNATRIISNYEFLQANVHFLIYDPLYYSSSWFQVLFNILEGKR